MLKLHHTLLVRTPRVVIATASPAKFPEAVAEALSVPANSDMTEAFPIPERISNLFHLPTKYDEQMQVGKDWTKILRTKIEALSSGN